MLAALLLTAACIIPQPSPLRRDYANTVETNSFYNDCGELVFVQNIFIDADGIETTVAWRMVKEPSQRPQRDWQAGGYVTTFDDGTCARQVRSRHVRESWTQYDPELVSRNSLPPDLRRGLKQQ